MDSVDKIIGDSYRGGRLIFSMKYLSLENTKITKEIILEIVSRPWP